MLLLFYFLHPPSFKQKYHLSPFLIFITLAIHNMEGESQPQTKTKHLSNISQLLHTNFTWQKTMPNALEWWEMSLSITLSAVERKILNTEKISFWFSSNISQANVRAKLSAWFLHDYNSLQNGIWKLSELLDPVPQILINFINLGMLVSIC